MAFIKRAVLRTDSGPAPEGEAGGSQPSQQQQSSENLSAVYADVSELMAPEKRKTLLFRAICRFSEHDRLLCFERLFHRRCLSSSRGGSDSYTGDR